MKEKIGFLAFHILFALLQITMPILGLYLISAVFYIAGGAIILFGLLSFLPGVKFWIVKGKYGYYEANNIKSCLITLLITIIVGAVIAYIPNFLTNTGLFVPIFSYLVTLLVGLKIMAENSAFECNLNSSVRILGRFVPVIYTIMIAIIILPLINPLIVIKPIVSMILMGVAGLYHLFRTIVVMINDPF